LKLIIQAFSNCFQNLFRNKLINLLSLAIIIFTLLIFSIFNFITYSIDTFTRQFSDNVEAIFYLKSNVPQQQIDDLFLKIKSNPLVEEISFKSKNQAEVDFSREFPQLDFILSEFENSPFPPSIEVSFNSAEDQDNLKERIINFIEEIEQNTIIETKQINLEWVKRLISLKRFISSIGIFLSFILIFISLFIVYNVIKINILYRKDEIGILKLVGATDPYIRIPFIIEGGFLGLLGSVISIILLIILLQIFPHLSPVMSNILNKIVISYIPPLYIIRNVIILGTIIGLISSFLSIRHFMKE
jgi:cell division transport system permease protein